MSWQPVRLPDGRLQDLISNLYTTEACVAVRRSSSTAQCTQLRRALLRRTNDRSALVGKCMTDWQHRDSSMGGSYLLLAAARRARPLSVLLVDVSFGVRRWPSRGTVTL